MKIPCTFKIQFLQSESIETNAIMHILSFPTVGIYGTMERITSYFIYHESAEAQDMSKFIEQNDVFYST